MFDELDDDRADLQPAETLPAVLVRGRALRRRRTAATTAVAGAAVALVGVLLVPLALGDGGTTSLVPAAPPPTSAATLPPPVAPVPTSPAPATPPSSTPVTAPPASTTPARPPVTPPATPPAPALVLGGDGLGVTAIGARRDTAVAAVSAALGRQPVADPYAHCVQGNEVSWGDFWLSFDTTTATLIGWGSTSRELATPSGVTVGTTVARLRQVYGDRVTFYPPNPDNGPSYAVAGVSMVGYVSGEAATDTVQALTNGPCAGP